MHTSLDFTSCFEDLTANFPALFVSRCLHFKTSVGWKCDIQLRTKSIFILIWQVCLLRCTMGKFHNLFFCLIVHGALSFLLLMTMQYSFRRFGFVIIRWWPENQTLFILSSHRGMIYSLLMPSKCLIGSSLLCVQT